MKNYLTKGDKKVDTYRLPENIPVSTRKVVTVSEVGQIVRIVKTT